MTRTTAIASTLLVLATTTPGPSPTDDVLRGDLNAYDVTPGLIGFLAIFAIAVVCVLGWFSMNRRVRRLRFAERALERETAGGAAGPRDAAQPDDAEPSDGSAPPRTEG